jgi:mRNA interferase MazF
MALAENAGPPAGRGEVWLVGLGAVRDGEPGKHRPCVVLSVPDAETGSSTELVIVVPLSTARSPSLARPAVAPGETGLTRQSVAVCRAVRGVARSRLARRLGAVPPQTLSQIAGAVTALIGGAASRSLTTGDTSP